MEKSLKKFLKKLLICIIINEIIKGNITLEEVYDLIDKAAEAKRIRKREEQRLREIEESNLRFQRVVNRFNRNRNNNENNGSYRSFLSPD
jgi:hypothetical protein